MPRPVSPAAPPLSAPAGGAAAATPGPAAATFELWAEPTVDVGLVWDADSAIVVTGVGAVVLAPAGAPGDGRHLQSAGRVAIRPSADGATVTAGAASVKMSATDTLWISPASGDSARLEWARHGWRGRFKVFVNPRRRLTLVDRLPLEIYLMGVVPGEIGALDDRAIEAGKAQAIAARSYTLFYRGRRGAEGFDLFGTVEDQLYSPIEAERPLATHCVEATRGRLAISEGFPIRANYCSTCGGITAAVWEAWPAAALPYLTSHTDRGSTDWCTASPQYRWHERWRADEFLENLRKFGPLQGVPMPAGGPGDLINAHVDSRSRSGRAWRLRVVTTNGDVVIPAYSIRQVLRRGGNPGAILRSNLFKIEARRDPLSGRVVAIEASGAGSGHGVGLCQTGALGMARSGASAEAILEHYYPGIRIERRY